MTFNINEFMQNAFPKDGARPNLFEIEFPNYKDLSPDNFKFKCRASSIPSSNIGMVGAYYFGRVVKLAGTRTFSDWTVTVMMDELDYDNGGIRSYLESWMSDLNSHVGNKRTNDDATKPENYMKDGVIKQYGKSGNVIATYKMIGCFPIAISEMPLDWGQNNTISEFNVTFAMQWWERENFTDSKTS